jgi:hypothetical protein
MRRSRLVCAILCVCIGVLPAFGQGKPRIAIIPLNPINVSRSDAEVVSGLLETALVKTEAYDVIEQREVSAVLEAQERSLSDCTDEKCAIAFGKLLAAEQIVLGTFSAIGGKYVLNAKIIDVAQGKNIKADTVELSRLDEVTQATELLAFKLAGLTYVSGQEVQIAQKFGEVFIETDPAGAEILINGARKGTSPELITRVPLGKIRVEARKDNLYAMQELEVTAKTGMLKLKLERQFGNLFVKSSAAAVDVYVDGKRLGPLGSGFFQDVEAGDHAIALQGEGLYWEGAVTVRSGESSRVEAYPREFGSLSFDLPEDATGEITGTNVREVIRGTGTLARLWVGSYSVRVSGTGFEPVTETVEIRKAQAEQFRPSLPLSREAEEKRFTERLAAAQKALDGEAKLDDTFVPGIEVLVRDLGESRHDFSEMAAKANALLGVARERKEKEAASVKNADEERARTQRIEELTKKHDDLQARLVTAQAGGGPRRTVGRVSLVLSGGTAIAAFVAKVLASRSYTAYNLATTTAEAISFRDQTRVRDGVFVGSLVCAGASAVVSVVTLAGRPKPSAIAEELRVVDEKLLDLRGGAK